MKTPCVRGIGFSTVVWNIILLLYLKYYTWGLTEHEELIDYNIGTYIQIVIYSVNVINVIV